MSALSPLPPHRFNAECAARLLWRAGFGGTWEEAEALADLGLDGAVDALVDFPGNPDLPEPACAALPELSDREFRDAIRDVPESERDELRNARRRAEITSIDSLKVWWLERMLQSSPRNPEVSPLEEKLTLFWHGHFASGFPDKIEKTHPLWRQNQTFRAHAAGRFSDLLAAVIRDPAMLVWLDNDSNRRGQPNENFARELMELFTTGVGPYSELDVKESARAFTGWTVKRDEWTFRFEPNSHDPDEKSFMGQTANFDGDGIAEILWQHPATATFLSRKLLDFFVCTAPDPDLVTATADFFRYRDTDVRELLHVLLRSQIFHSDEAAASIVKSPVVLAIGALKAMDVPLPDGTLLLPALRLMGQNLFYPPDVNGWPGGPDWINSNTLLIRYNFANFLLNGVSPDEFKVFDAREAGSARKRREFVEGQRNPNAVDWSPRRQLEEADAARRLLGASDIVDYYIAAFLQRPASPDLRDSLLRFAETDASGGRRSMSVNDSNFDERARGIVHLIMSSPDYQLC